MTEPVREIGHVRFVQVQREPLKVGERLDRRYDPAPLLIVERLAITNDGILGFTSNGERVMDVHHVNHPQTRNRGRLNGLSIGFTSHYEALRNDYGSHVTAGCAGENVIIDADRAFALTDLSGGILIKNMETGQIASLEITAAIDPCAEFSRFINRKVSPLHGHKLKETLSALGGGRRGFLATLKAGLAEATVATGDRVFLAASGTPSIGLDQAGSTR